MKILTLLFLHSFRFYPRSTPYCSSWLNFGTISEQRTLVKLSPFSSLEESHSLMSEGWTFPLGKLGVPLPCPLPSQEECGQRHINERNNQCQDLILQLRSGLFRTSSKIVCRDSCHWKESAINTPPLSSSCLFPLYNSFAWYLHGV